MEVLGHETTHKMHFVGGKHEVRGLVHKLDVGDVAPPWGVQVGLEIAHLVCWG
jgi:5-keto 4-deoxyuronate isomerase